MNWLDSKQTPVQPSYDLSKTVKKYAIDYSAHQIKLLLQLHHVLPKLNFREETQFFLIGFLIQIQVSDICDNQASLYSPYYPLSLISQYSLHSIKLTLSRLKEPSRLEIFN